MKVPLEIAFHDCDPPDWVETEIRQRVAKLDALYDRLTACRVSVEVPHRQRQTGNVPMVRIELSVPGRNLVVSREPRNAQTKYVEPDLHTAIRDAFKAAERQLKEFKQQIRGEVKRHPVAFQGQVTQLYPNEDHGFLLTSEGSQLYFHRNSVLNNDFDKLGQGDTVHYVEMMGDTGPTASKVWLGPDHDLD